MENIEILIEIRTKTQTPLQPLTSLKNTQYTIDVLDFKRIRTSFPSSPFQNIANQSIKTSQRLLDPKLIASSQQDSMVSLSLTSSLVFNDTAENMLCSGNAARIALKPEYSPTDVFSVASSNIKNLNSQGEQSMTNMLNETSFTNFSSITESTRIQPRSASKNTDNDNTINAADVSSLSNCQNTILEGDEQHSLTSQVCPLKVDRRGETSNWIKDLDDENNSIVGRSADLELGKPDILFRIQKESTK